MDWEDNGYKGKAFWLVVEGKYGQKLRRGLSHLVNWDPFYGDVKSYKFAHGQARSSRIAIVNHFITLNGYKSYLEIGVRHKKAMFEEILCPNRTSVDPDPNAHADHCVPSDQFFETSQDRYDIVFIDGNHTGDQVKRDIENSLKCLSPGGVILLHDMNPPTLFHARRDYEVDGHFPSWNGTSWEGFAAIRRSRSDLSMYVVDTDWGVGIVHPGSQETYGGPCETFEELSANRRAVLNLISVPEFLAKYAKSLQSNTNASGS